MTIALQSERIYGPLRSRRFGLSLGINLLPADRKVCNYDCVYCQYENDASKETGGFPSPDELKEEFAAAAGRLAASRVRVDRITIAGNGEPTLHPQFEDVVDSLLGSRDQWMPDVPVGILSNSSTCHLPSVRAALSRLDGRYMKLDAGNLPPERVLEGLRSLKNTVLQSLFFDGAVRNTSPSQIGEWIDAVARIRPHSVQVYTIDRPTRLEGLCRVPTETLNRIAEDLFTATQVPAETY